MREVITHAEQATPEWLTAVLYKNGCLPQGHVVSVNKKPSPPGFSTIVPLELSYSENAPPSAPARLVLKLAGAGDLSTGKEEVEFYTCIAAAMSDPPVVRCYDAVYSEQASRSHLLMEDLSETHISHPPSMLPPPQAHAEQIVDALACIHAHWWDHPRLGREVGVVPTAASLGAEMAENEQRWRAFADLLGDRLSIERRGVYERVLASFLPVQLRRLAVCRSENTVPKFAPFYSKSGAQDPSSSLKSRLSGAFFSKTRSLRQAASRGKGPDADPR